MQYDSIYTKYKNRLNSSIMFEVRIGMWVMTEKKPSWEGGVLYYCCIFFFLFMVPSAAYGSSPARPQIRASAEAHTTATRDLSHIHNLCSSSWQCQILNPLSEVRGGTHILSPWVLNPQWKLLLLHFIKSIAEIHF